MITKPKPIRLARLFALPTSMFAMLAGMFALAMCLLASVVIRPALAAAGQHAGAAAAPDASVKVMSFNIRFGTANDGDNHWDKRKDFVVDTIKAFNPDLLGTQETLKFQRDFLAEHLTDYEVMGVGRDDGQDAGEMMALYFRRERFEKLDGGHFWLSQTPEIVGSKSWDSSLPRMVTWVKLRDRRQPKTAAPLVLMNTHFDHRGPEARTNSALLIRSRASAAVADGCRVIVTGDFNAAEDSSPYHALFQDADQQPSVVVDSFRIHYPDRSPDEGTFSGFRSSETKGARIDWIAVSRDWKIINAQIDRTERAGRTPSDHLPVTAILQ